MQSINKQKGSMLMVGIFILTSIFLLAFTLNKILSESSNNYTIEVFGEKALLAANSGADYGLSKIFPLNGGAPNCNSSTVNITLTPNIAAVGCSATITCNYSSYTDGANTKRLYTIKSEGTCEAGCSGDRFCYRAHREVVVKANPDI